MIPYSPQNQPLFVHQIEAAQIAYARRKVIIAHDMGLGKTRSALAAAKATCLPVIVISPASVIGAWKSEAAIMETRITICSWAKVPERLPYIGGFVLIVDEAHYAQSMSSQRTKRMLKLAANATYVFLLTGTPMKNGRPMNLYPLLRAIGHPLGEAKSRSYFEVRYCNAQSKQVYVKGGQGQTRKVWDNSGARNLVELKEKLNGVMLRKTKAECIDLPAKMRIMREIELTEEMNYSYKTVLSKFMDAHIETAGQAMVMLGAMRQASSIAKIETAIEMASELIEEGQSVVLFTEYVETAKQIAKALSCEMIIGEVATADRPAIIRRFQEGQYRAIVCTIRAGGTGITLTRAQTVILVDRPWTPGDALQAEDRLHRIGQTNAVTVYWLQSFDVDKKIDTILLSKMKNISELTGEQELDFVAIANELRS